MWLIEYMWDLVRRHLSRDRHPTASKYEIWLRIKAVRISLPQADIENLFHSIPRRITSIIVARGSYTKS